MKEYPIFPTFGEIPAFNRGLVRIGKRPLADVGSFLMGFFQIYLKRRQFFLLSKINSSTVGKSLLFVIFGHNFLLCWISDIGTLLKNQITDSFSLKSALNLAFGQASKLLSSPSNHSLKESPPEGHKFMTLCAERQKQNRCLRPWRRQPGEKFAIHSGHPAKSKKAAFTGNSPLKTTSTTALTRYPNPSAILLKITTKEKSNATTYPRPRPAVKSFTH
jgi:hypothetical protein